MRGASREGRVASGFAGIAAVAGRQAFWDSIMTDSHDGFIPYRNQAYEDRSWVGTYRGKDSEKNEIWDGGVPVTYGQYFRPISADVKYSKGYAQFDVNHVTCLSDPAIWGGSSFKGADFGAITDPLSALYEVKAFLGDNGITIGTTTLVAP
jgi:hypothetical protein